MPRRRPIAIPDAGDRGGLTQDQAQEAARPGAERDADAEFLLALVHGVRDGGEEADHRQRHAKHAQHADARGGGALREERKADPVVERRGPGEDVDAEPRAWLGSAARSWREGHPAVRTITLTPCE